jgi:HAD superfamily hydrolase (TIGR01509 family)
MTGFKAILWDNDGVLVDTEHLYLQATREILATAGVALSDAQYCDLFLNQNNGAWHLASELGHSAPAIARMREARDARYSALLRVRNHTIAGVEDVLKSLHGRYAMGVVTSSQRCHFDIIHAATGLMRYFDFVLTREDYVNSKPDPEPYRAGIAKTGLRAHECIAVEDTLRGLTAATAAGMKCVVIPNALSAGRDFSAAHRVLSHIGEFPAVLDEARQLAPI